MYESSRIAVTPSLVYRYMDTRSAIASSVKSKFSACPRSDDGSEGKSRVWLFQATLPTGDEAIRAGGGVAVPAKMVRFSKRSGGQDARQAANKL